MSTNTKYPGPEVLRDLYDDKKLSCVKIAAIMGVSPSSAERWLKKAGIIPRQHQNPCITYRLPRDLAERLRVPESGMVA